MELHHVFVILICSAMLPYISGQLLSRESLLTMSNCHPTSATLSCGSDAVIAVQNVQYGYRSTCGTSCCQYSPTDCLEDASNKQDIIRECSGQSSCNVPAQPSYDFCSFGIVTASYIYLEYFCIPKTRISSVCSSVSPVSTTGEPLYLTNVDYPKVTVGTTTCTCSFEAQSCSSDIQRYVFDADLYLDTSSCQQNLNFTNSEGLSLGVIACESYYNNFITESYLSSNYIKVTFVSDSTQNREGLFFIGFTASEPNITLTLNCSQQKASWCIDCGMPAVANGIVTLNSDTSAGATANVTCNPGFQPDTPVITCRPEGLWDNATCSPIDCGQVPSMANGMINLNDAGSTTFKSSANVTCTSGYDASTNTITCLDTGQWLEANCTIKVDGGWSSWSTWNMCSETCGSGLQSRNRTCDNPIPHNGGEICNGDSTEQHTCYEADCLDIGPVTVPKTDYTLLIIIVVCCAAFVWIVQLTSVACLVRKEHNQHLKTTGKGKVLIALGCFPVLGIPILICISCSLKNRKYYVEQDYGSWAASTNTPYTIQTVNRSYPSFSSLYEETEIELPKEYTSANVHNNTTNLNYNSTSHNNSDVNTNTSNNMNNIQYTHKKNHHKKN